MMDQWQQIGLGTGLGISLLIIKDVVHNLLGKIGRSPNRDENGHARSGNKSVEFWQQQMRITTEEALDNKIGPLLESQNRLLGVLIEQQRQTNEGIVKLITLEEVSQRRAH